MRSGIDPAANALTLQRAIEESADNGALMLFTPEMSGLLDRNRARAAAHLHTEAEDPLLAQVRNAAKSSALWVSLGSLALKSESDGAKLVNRSFVIDDQGQITARYDKMHLFDVDLANGESWRESAAYSAGDQPVLTETPVGRLGLSICYDVRFPALYQALSGAGASILIVPAAFTVPTGQAHWQTLLRARAIENAAFVVAAAQGGVHEDGRETYGHSLVVDPWGRVLLEMGKSEGLAYVEIELSAVDEARARIPVIAHRKTIPSPKLLS
jgi:deaminated glutathione amidase